PAPRRGGAPAPPGGAIFLQSDGVHIAPESRERNRAEGGEAFYWYFGDLIAERFMAALDMVHDWSEGGLPIADRRKRIAEIDQEIETLIERRDGLIGQLNSVGITE
ncbi:MAG: hypothetical protein MK097_21375, partial [Dechloromonas sp.]|nr:hypothetical protein [Dechloromonas sp.]